MPSLFGSMFGDNRLANFDSIINKLITTIPNNQDSSMSSTIIGSEEATGNFIDSFLTPTNSEDSDDKYNKKKSKGPDEFDLNRLFDTVTIPRERLARYEAYEEIYRGVPLIKRMVSVYNANILQKNPTTGKCILYRDTDGSDAKEDVDSEEFKNKKTEAEDFAAAIVKNYKIIDKLSKKIIPLIAIYGDCFIEVVDIVVESEKVDLNNISRLLTENEDPVIEQDINSKLLAEAKSLEKDLDSVSNQYNGTSLDVYLERLSNLLVREPDLSVLYEDDTVLFDVDPEETNQTDQTDNTNKNVKYDFSKVIVKVHKPHRILALETKYGTRIGYLEVTEDSALGKVTDIGRTLSAAVGKINTLATRGSVPKEDLVNKLIYNIIRKLVSKSKKSKDVETTIRGLGDEVYYFIKRMIIEQGAYKDKLGVKQFTARFIPPNRMVQFCIPSSDYDPYGAAIIDPLILPSKLYILSQLSNIINKLSRASLIRTWTISLN